MGKTAIQWTDFSVSPIRARDKKTGKVFHHCEKISSGCANCYAEKLALRFGLHEYTKANTDKVEFFLDESKLQSVMKRKKPTKFFWEDCSDMFGWWVNDEWIDQCFAAMALTPHHTHQVLTKRPERMAEYLATPDRHNRLELAADALRPGKGHLSFGGKHMLPGLPFENVWLGVSVENQKAADYRIPHLLKTPANVRFLSCEPLLGPVDLHPIINNFGEFRNNQGINCDWVIIGGESGRGSRECHLSWIRSIVHQCQEAGVAVFVKQLGAKPIENDRWDCYATEPEQVVDGLKIGIQDRVTMTMGGGEDCDYPLLLKSSKGGDWDEWPNDLRIREFPESASALTGG